MKRRLRRLLALVCALALALSLSGPASAAGDIYFTVINDSVVSLSDSTMPTWSGGVLYVPYSAFDGSNTARIGFDISFSYNRSSGTQRPGHSPQRPGLCAGGAGVQLFRPELLGDLH